MGTEENEAVGTDLVQVKLRLPANLVDHLDTIAKGSGASRTAVAQVAISVGLGAMDERLLAAVERVANPPLILDPLVKPQSAADKAIELKRIVNWEIDRLVKEGRLQRVGRQPDELEHRDDPVDADVALTVEDEVRRDLLAATRPLTAQAKYGQLPAVAPPTEKQVVEMPREQLEEHLNRQARRIDLAKKAVADKGLKLNDTAHRHVHKPGEVLDTFWEKGTRFIQYSCADEACEEILNRRA